MIVKHLNLNLCALGLSPVSYTGLFISPSGISELDCATTKTDTAERSISIGRESHLVSVLPAVPSSHKLLTSEGS